MPLGSTPVRVRQLLGSSPHTRYPVFEQDLDHIVGMIHIKDLLRLLLRNESVGQAHARPLPLIPETAPLDTVLAAMRRERTQMAIVIDEHGGTSGIVTLEDLFEEVVGDIDEGPGSPPQSYRDADGRLRVPGTMRLDELGQHFHLDLEHEDVDSVSGLILTLLGRAPAVGDSVRYDRLVLDVTAVKGRGVEEAAVTLGSDFPAGRRELKILIARFLELPFPLRDHDGREAVAHDVHHRPGHVHQLVDAEDQRHALEGKFV